MFDDEQEAELRNPFPSPPSHYQRYTSHNLRLFELLVSRRSVNEATEDQIDQREVLADQKDVPEWSLTQLEKPRVDWIVEDGHFSVFGDTWFIKEKIPSLGELGGQQLYPEDPTCDRRPALLSIMRSMLATYSHLLRSLLSPPPSPVSPDAPEWRKHVEWLRITSQNIMSAVNDLRPVQARHNLETMMTRQLELRCEETAVLHRKCDDLQRVLSELKSNVLNLEQSDRLRKPFTLQTIEIPQEPSMDDVLRWAEDL